jgi:sugar transferase (PEP-CTERM/EpsH1 system associated)
MVASCNLRTQDQLHVVHVMLALDVGGLERNVVNQVREGQKLGQRVSIVCLDRPGTLAPRIQQLGANLVVLDRRPGIRPGMVLQVRRALRDLRPDVVHTHQLATLLYGGAAARMLRVPVVVHTEHAKEEYQRRRKRMLGRIAGLFCDRFYCLTKDMVNHVRSAGILPERKIQLIQNGIDVASFTRSASDRAAIRQSLNVPPDALLIGTVGRLNEVKRQDVLIRAFAQVRQHTPDAHLVLVGEGPALNDLQTLVSSHGLTDCVHFAGYQPHSGPYLQAMDIFALTSRSEGMPQAVLEASVTGLPVVASRVGGLPEVIEDGVSGIMFEAGNDAALATIFRELIANADLRKRLGAAARARVESKFSVARMAAEYHRDFLTLLRNRSGRIADRAEIAVPTDLAIEDCR